MPKYSVNIEGKNYLSDTAAQNAPTRFDFYVIRYTKADSSEEAKRFVLNHLKKEIEQKLIKTQHSSLKVVKVQAVTDIEGGLSFGEGISGTGFMVLQEKQSWIDKLLRIFKT